MWKEQIIIKRIESLVELQRLIKSEPLLSSDDMQNTFCLVSMGDNIVCGIAYYDYGIKPIAMLLNNNSVLYLGFGKKIIVIEIRSGRCIGEEELSSIFYDFIVNSFKTVVCAICELDIYCLELGKIAWKMGFRDIVDEYSLTNDKEVNVICNDGSKVVFSLKDGTILG